MDDATTVEVERRLQCDLTAAWRAWTDPHSLTAWLWPFPTIATIDLRPGGIWRVEARELTMAAGGPITVVEHEERLEWDWAWADDDHTSHVRMTIAPSTDGGVDCTVLHTRNRDAAEVQRHREGWEDCLDRLVRRLG